MVSLTIHSFFSKFSWVKLRHGNLHLHAGFAMVKLGKVDSLHCSDNFHERNPVILIGIYTKPHTGFAKGSSCSHRFSTLTNRKLIMCELLLTTDNGLRTAQFRAVKPQI